jgi:branched-chain amino acid transport system ATP-binding protein
MTAISCIQLEEIDVSHGHVQAISGFSLSIQKGQFATVLGPNGAGKSTLLKSIIGLVPPRAGKIIFEDQEIQRSSPNQIARQGISLVPEGRRIFQGHTVEENLLLGGYLIRRNAKLLSETLDYVFELFPILADRRKQLGGTLSGGEAQMLAIARALMVRPRLLLLDEPSLGLAPQIVVEILGHLRNLNEVEGLTILLVEQTAALALEYSSYAILMSQGKIVVEGSPAEMKTHEEVTRVYFGS